MRYMTEKEGHVSSRESGTIGKEDHLKSFLRESMCVLVCVRESSVHVCMSVCSFVFVIT